MFRTIFTTLRALLKSGLCATLLCIRSDTASYGHHDHHDHQNRQENQDTRHRQDRQVGKNREDRQIWHLNLIFQVSCLGQLSQFLRCLIISPSVLQNQISFLPLNNFLLFLAIFLFSKATQFSKYQSIMITSMKTWECHQLKRFANTERRTNFIIMFVWFVSSYHHMSLLIDQHQQKLPKLRFFI